MIASAGADRDGNSYNVNADTAAGKVAAALAAHKAIFLTDVTGWLADPDEPELAGHAAPRSTRSRGAGRGRRRHAPEARGLRRGDPRRRRLRPHRRRPRARTRCCSSSSRTPASARWSRSERRRAAGAGGALRDAHLRPGAGRVRPRRGGAALGLRRQGVPRLLRRPLGPQRGPLSSRDRRGHPGAGRTLRRQLEPLLLRAGDAPVRAPRRVEPRRPGVPLQLGRPRRPSAR